MKLTISLLTAVSYAFCFANAEFPKIKKILHHHPYDPTFEPSKAEYNIHHLPLPSDFDQISRLPRRDHVLVQKPPPQKPSTSPTPNFLPPPWSPTSKLDSPYSLTGVSPYDDGGRSEVLDNEPSVQAIWRTCPASNLDCAKCPRDKRCRHKGTPWWQIDPTIQIDDGGLVPDVCPLSTCTAAPGGCGKNAKCVREHCVCETGWKGGVGSIRGFEGLQATTVWVDSGVAFDVQCDGWGCEEVNQVGACFGVASSSATAGTDDVETSGTGAGAVRAPGANGEASQVKRDIGYCGA